MTNRQLDTLRKLQDRLVRLAEAAGYGDEMRVSVDMPATATVGNVRQTLWPGYEGEMQSVIDCLERGD